MFHTICNNRVFREIFITVKFPKDILLLIYNKKVLGKEVLISSLDETHFLCDWFDFLF